jgi:transcriptional regulator with XRE-family HTH domain
MEDASFESRLKSERLRRGMRQSDAATHFGIAQPSYCRWERGKNRPSVGNLPALATFLGLEVRVLSAMLGMEDVRLEASYAEIARLQGENTSLRLVAGGFQVLEARLLEHQSEIEQMKLRLSDLAHLGLRGPVNSEPNGPTKPWA